jgi:hypothetical protein
MCKVSEEQETPLLSWITSLLGKISCPFDPILRELNLCSYFRCSMSIPNANNPENQFHFLAPRVCWRPNDAACRSCSILQAFTNLLDTGIPQPRQKMEGMSALESMAIMCGDLCGDLYGRKRDIRHVMFKY